MGSLLIRNLIFTILQPGIVAGFVPYLILQNESKALPTWPINPVHFLAIWIFFLGAFIMFNCIASFAIKGKGTLSPVDQTKQLVISGLYRYSRNPMYVGVVLILIGEALFFQSNTLWIYSVIIFLVFNIFILFVEEPRLRRDFKDQYENYCQQVRRWI